MKRIYVAGAYSGPDMVSILGNMRRGLQLAHQVLKAGYAPFAPWLDFQFGLVGETSLQEFYRYSMTWLEVSDAVLVVSEGAEQSHGTQVELARARELQIPIFWALEHLQTCIPTQDHDKEA